jgi:hypothetical protein
VLAERYFGFHLGRRQVVGGGAGGLGDRLLCLGRRLAARPGVQVIALTSVAANLTAIIGGILVFRDPVGTGEAEITGRMIAFFLVIVGAALMPAPMRATREPSH